MSDKCKHEWEFIQGLSATKIYRSWPAPSIVIESRVYKCKKCGKYKEIAKRQQVIEDNQGE